MIDANERHDAVARIASVTGPISVVSLNGGYRVRARHPIMSYEQDFFDGDAQSAMAFATALKDHFESVDAWMQLPLDRKLPSPRKGLSAHVHKPAGDSMARIAIRSRSGEVANMHFMHSNPFSCFVHGVQTIDGQPSVAEHRRRQGLATWLHDMASEIAGKPIVPHGRNLCTGFLTQEGAAFWDARALRRPYPGSTETPEIRDRLAVTTASIELLRTEMLYAPDRTFASRFATIAAMALGGKVEGTLHARDGLACPHADAVWTLLSDGTRIFCSGVLPDDAANALLLAPATSGWRREAAGLFEPVDILRMEIESHKEYGAITPVEEVIDWVSRSWAEVAVLLDRHGIAVIPPAPPEDVMRTLESLRHDSPQPMSAS